jgi:ABC-type uncharacterized transport system permease subunit
MLEIVIGVLAGRFVTPIVETHVKKWLIANGVK